MTKRISIKGRGANIFFGDDVPLDQQRPTRQPPVARMQVSKNASKHASVQVSIEARLRQRLRSPTLTPNTFRYAPEELAAIRDMAYVMETKYQQKTTKNDIIRIALNWLLEDFNEKRGESTLVKVLTHGTEG